MAAASEPVFDLNADGSEDGTQGASPLPLESETDTNESATENVPSPETAPPSAETPGPYEAVPYHSGEESSHDHVRDDSGSVGDVIAADAEPHKAQSPTIPLPLIAAPFGLRTSNAKAHKDYSSEPAEKPDEDDDAAAAAVAADMAAAAAAVAAAAAACAAAAVVATTAAKPQPRPPAPPQQLEIILFDVFSVEPEAALAGRTAGIGPTKPKTEPRFELPPSPLLFTSSLKVDEDFVRPEARTPSKMMSVVQHQPRMPCQRVGDCQCEYTWGSAPMRSPGPWPAPSPPTGGPPAAPRSPDSAEAARVLTKIISVRSRIAAAANAECQAANQAAADVSSQRSHAVGSPPRGVLVLPAAIAVQADCTCAPHKETKRTLESLAVGQTVGSPAAKRPKGWPKAALNLTNPAPKPAKVAPTKARGGRCLFYWPEAAAVTAASAMLKAFAAA